jgi:hypothetical protein
MNLRVPQKARISRLGEQILASQKGLCSRELDFSLFRIEGQAVK